MQKGKLYVISAPSGLTLGGGFEVMVQSNFVASHTNIVVGLVEITGYFEYFKCLHVS